MVLHPHIFGQCILLFTQTDSNLFIFSVPDFTISLKIPRPPAQPLGSLSQHCDLLVGGLRAPSVSILPCRPGDFRSSVIQRADAASSMADSMAAALQNPFSLYQS